MYQEKYLKCRQIQAVPSTYGIVAANNFVKSIKLPK
jgi:hypothetical protein